MCGNGWFTAHIALSIGALQWWLIAHTPFIRGISIAMIGAATIN